MACQAPGRRRKTPCTYPLLTRALGAVCLAGARTLSAAFITPSCGGGGLYEIKSTATNAATPAAAAADPTATATFRRCHAVGGSGGSRDGPSSRVRPNQLAMVSATADAPAVASSPATAAEAGGAATTSGRRKRGTRRTPPLTIDEERALLVKINDARLLRNIQQGLELAASAAAAAGGGKREGVDGNGAAEGGVATSVTMQAWAREASLEEQELSRALREGIDAKRTLVERNMPMVIRMVEEQYRWRLRGGQVSFADLLQEGAYALGLAADQFNPAMPNRFLTYALYTVRDKLDIALARGNSAISVPASALKELHRARRELTAELGRSPSEAELANFFANGVVVDDRAPAATTTAGAAAAAAALVEEGETRRGDADGHGGRSTVVESRPRGLRSRAVAGGEFSIKVASSDKEARQQARIRRRRLNLLSAVQKVTSIDRLIRANDGSSMVPLVDTLIEDLGSNPLSAAGDIAELLPRVLTPRQANLVRMACGLADGRPMTMAECSKELSLSVSRTKSLFESSLEKLREAAKADNPSRLVRQP